MPPKVKNTVNVEPRKTPARAPKEEKPPELPSAGRTDDFGNLYLEEIDLLRLMNRRLRIQACRHQADALRHRAENIELKMQAEIKRHRASAYSFESAAKTHDADNADHLTDLSKRYGIDLKDPNIVIDDESGKIGLIDPEKGLPKL